MPSIFGFDIIVQVLSMYQSHAMEDRTQQFLHRQRKCLTLMGHSLVPNVNESRWKQIPQLLVTFVVASGQYPMIYYAVYHRNDLELVTASMSIDFTNMLTTIKIVTFLINKVMFLEIMSDLKKMWQNCDYYASKNIQAANVSADRMLNLYFYCVSCTGTYFLGSPLVKIAWAKISNQLIVRELPMPMRFFFDTEQSPGYEIAFFYTGWITLAVVMHAVAIDGLFITFAIHLRAHFRLLQHYISTNSFNKIDEKINYDICSFIKYHSKLLRLAEKICQTYKPIIFGQFLMTSLQVCVIVYQVVTHMDNMMVLVVYVTFLASILIQLLIYCYGGEILKIESLMVGTSVQLSKWYRLQPKYRKMLCLLMQRSQKEVLIQAGFYEASLANFMMIIKAALSYITLIQSIE